VTVKLVMIPPAGLAEGYVSAGGGPSAASVAVHFDEEGDFSLGRLDVAPEQVDAVSGSISDSTIAASGGLHGADHDRGGGGLHLRQQADGGFGVRYRPPSRIREATTSAKNTALVGRRDRPRSCATRIELDACLMMMDRPIRLMSGLALPCGTDGLARADCLPRSFFFFTRECSQAMLTQYERERLPTAEERTASLTRS